MNEFIINLVELLNDIPSFFVYLVISISSILQQWFPPYPGDTFAAVAGFTARAADFSVVGMFLTFWGSTVISSIALFELGKRLGKKVLQSKTVMKYFPKKPQETASGFIHR